MRGRGWTRPSTAATRELLRHFRELAADHLEVIAGDKGEADLGLDEQTWQRLADTVDLIVDSAALVNACAAVQRAVRAQCGGHRRADPVGADHASSSPTPMCRLLTWAARSSRRRSPRMPTSGSSARRASSTAATANGYGNSKWAGEVLLREAHDLCGLPVSVFRCDMILVDTSICGPAQRGGHVHADGAEPGGHRRGARIVLSARRRGQPAAGALRRAAGAVSSPRRSPRWVPGWPTGLRLIT